MMREYKIVWGTQGAYCVIVSRVLLLIQGGGDASNVMSHLNLESSHRGTQVMMNTRAEKTSCADLTAPIRARMRITRSASEGKGGWGGGEDMSWNQVGDRGRGDCDEQESSRVRPFLFPAPTATRTQRTNQARSEPSPAPSEVRRSELGYSGRNSPPPCRSLQGASNSFRD
jgi:hypothetical protein